VPLIAGKLDEAKAKLERARTNRNDGRLPKTGFRPKFEDLAADYLADPLLVQKKISTQRIERQAIRRLITLLGGTRMGKIAPLPQ
jgi:hypothetical protein